MYDLIILGGGPAAAAGAIYAARKQLKTLLITGEWGGQSSVSTEIFNWIGTPSISGLDLATALEKHVRAYEGEMLAVKSGEWAKQVAKNADGNFTVATDKDSYIGKTILIATGSSRKKLDVPGAAEYENKGITYCASCDGPVFSGQDVAVIGGGNAGFESAAQLLAYCKSVTLIIRGENFRADEITVNALLKNPKLTVIKNADILRVEGTQFVDKLAYKDKTSGEEKMLPVGGIFVEIGQIPNTGLVDGVAKLDEFKKIIVDPMTQMTTQDGVWAAGDCTNGLYHQNNIASGDAVKALENLYQWVQKRK